MRFVHRCTFWVCPVSEKYNNQNWTCVWFAGDEKTRQMAIVFTQQTAFYLQRKIASQFCAITSLASN